MYYCGDTVCSKTKLWVQISAPERFFTMKIYKLTPCVHSLRIAKWKVFEKPICVYYILCILYKRYIWSSHKRARISYTIKNTNSLTFLNWTIGRTFCLSQCCLLCCSYHSLCVIFFFSLLLESFFMWAHDGIKPKMKSGCEKGEKKVWEDVKTTVFPFFATIAPS